MHNPSSITADSHWRTSDDHLSIFHPTAHS